MQEFRILGPLEVTSEEGPIALGGPRQRALLAALLLRAGRVVPTEQLVDELYGAEPPKTATASLQNSVAALQEGARAGRARHAVPGLRARGLTRADRRASLRADARRRAEPRPPRSGARSSLRALDLWRGPPLAEFAFEEWAQTEARRLDELRLVAVEERIAADVELGRAADVVPELESLVREHPLRERPLRAAHARPLPRRAARPRRSSAYTDARAALDELGIEPGDKLRHLQAAILRHEAGSHPGRRRRTSRTRTRRS